MPSATVEDDWEAVLKTGVTVAAAVAGAAGVLSTLYDVWFWAAERAARQRFEAQR